MALCHFNKTNHHVIMMYCMDGHIKADLNPIQIKLSENEIKKNTKTFFVFYFYFLGLIFYITPDVDVILISVLHVCIYYTHSFCAIH